MNRDAVATTSIDAPSDRVWQALTDPDEIAQYFMGTRVVTDWTVGGPIEWHGEWNGKQFTDSGKVLAFEPGRRIEVTHWSPVTEVEHTVAHTIETVDGATQVTITQGRNTSADEIAESERTWAMVLGKLKDYVESSASTSSA